MFLFELIEIVWLVYWFDTFNAAALCGKAYRQRLAVTVAMLVFLLLTGEVVGKALFAVLAGWAMAVELFCLGLAVMGYDERLFPTRRTA